MRPQTGETKFNLLANVHHEGDADGGIFKVQVLNKANETWYEIEDLHVQETLPQLVALSPSYLQIYEHKPVTEHFGQAFPTKFTLSFNVNITNALGVVMDILMINGFVSPAAG